MGLFTPSYMKKITAPAEIEKACKAVDRITDQARLLHISRNAPTPEVRIRAAVKAEDAPSLAEICIQGNKGQKSGAFNALKYNLKETEAQQDALAQIAIRCPDDYYQKVAIENIKNDEPLARIAREASDGSVARYAAFRIKDQDLLAKLAKEASAPVRGEAVSQLQDPDLIRTFAQDPSPAVRLSVAKHRMLKDSELRDRMALEDPDPEVRLAAVKNTAGPVSSAVLASVLLKDSDPDVRKAAAENSGCTDSAALAKALLEDRNSEVRAAVVRNCCCSDPAALGKAALEDPNPVIRRLAVEKPKMRDPEVLTRIAEDRALDEQLRATAIRKGVITDQALLTKIALDRDERGSVRAAAVSFLTDPEPLTALIQGYPVLRREAAVRLAHVAPAQAVEPLIELLLYYENNQTEARNREAENQIREAVNILKTQFLTAKDPAVRQKIGSLPNRRYGWTCVDHCGNHSDYATHLDVSAVSR